MKTYHRELLTNALDAREREVTEYQVNIDNYRRAIEKIGEDAELHPFKEQLDALLSASILEQRKAKIMLEVVREQLEENQ